MKKATKIKKSDHTLPLIELRNLCKSFGKQQVLNDLHLDVFKNESLVILGRSGVGKSVLIKCLVGLIQPDSGSIRLEGNEISSLSEEERSQLMSKFGFLFQGGALFDSMPVWKNIAFFALHNKKVSVDEARDIAADKLLKVGLGLEILDRYPQELSGGMQKRVAFARTIAHNPEILLFDEPTTGLDPTMARTINELIVRIRKTMHATMITITHDLNSTHLIGTRVALLHQGKIAWTGPIKELDRSHNRTVEHFIRGEA